MGKLCLLPNTRWLHPWLILDREDGSNKFIHTIGEDIPDCHISEDSNRH
jgi:hypothetical protein